VLDAILMACAIDFHYEANLAATEINGVRPNWVLPAEL